MEIERKNVPEDTENDTTSEQGILQDFPLPWK